jgi:hypothetical protein
MLEFMSENFYFLVSLLCTTALCWFIGIFFASRRTLCIFFGAWYLALGFLVVFTVQYKGDFFPFDIVLTHLACIFALSKIFRTPFSWKKYLVFAVSSLLFSAFALYWVLDATISAGHK